MQLPSFSANLEEPPNLILQSLQHKLAIDEIVLVPIPIHPGQELLFAVVGGSPRSHFNMSSLLMELPAHMLYLRVLKFTRLATSAVCSPR
jgi:hypothetical protein